MAVTWNTSLGVRRLRRLRQLRRLRRRRRRPHQTHNIPEISNFGDLIITTPFWKQVYNPRLRLIYMYNWIPEIPSYIYIYIFLHLKINIFIPYLDTKLFNWHKTICLIWRSFIQHWKDHIIWCSTTDRIRPFLLCINDLANAINENVLSIADDTTIYISDVNI